MERRALQELEQQGFTAFLPSYLRRKSHARKITIAPASLFPGYLFVSFDTQTQRWQAINGTIGVVRLLAGLQGPSPLPAGFAEDLLARRDERGCVSLPSRSFDVGDRVKVSGGSFAHAVGFYDGQCDRDRVEILLELLGRKVRVELEGSLLERAA
jgi:transcriptional antiterminator RfaH